MLSAQQYNKEEKLRETAQMPVSYSRELHLETLAQNGFWSWNPAPLAVFSKAEHLSSQITRSVVSAYSKPKLFSALVHGPQTRPEWLCSKPQKWLTFCSRLGFQTHGDLCFKNRFGLLQAFLSMVCPLYSLEVSMSNCGDSKTAAALDSPVTLRGRHPAKTLGIRFECQHDGCLHFLVGFIQIHKTENSRSSRYAQEKRCYWWNMSTQSKAGIANQGPCRFIGV